MSEPFGFWGFPVTTEERSNEDAAELVATHDEYPALGPWDRCDGCHVEYVRSLLARIAAVEAKLKPSALFDALYDAMYGQISVGAEEREAVAQVAESLAAALAASSTPTGPEPEKCEHGWTAPHNYTTGSPHYWNRCAGPGGADPKETDQ